MKIFNLNQLFLIVILSGGLFACLPDATTDNEEDRAIRAYLTNMGVDYEIDPSGVYYYPIQTNPTGKAIVPGDQASIYYIIEVLNSNIVDSLSDQRGPPIKFRHGTLQMVPSGIDFGVAHMRVGETFILLIPSRHGYGNVFVDDLFPSDATLKVELQLVEVTDGDEISLVEDDIIADYIEQNNLGEFELLAGGLRYKTTLAGSGLIGPPVNGETIIVNYRGFTLDGQLVEEQDNQLIIVGESRLSIEGLDQAVLRMDRGEKATFILPSNLAYANEIVVLPLTLGTTPVQPFTILTYEIERTL